MNLKRAFIFAMVACMLPGLAMAQRGEEVRFLVTKNFTDTNPAPVTVMLECNDGFISQDGMAEITDDGIGHTFIVTGLTRLDAIICELTEDPADAMGYENLYTATSSSTIEVEVNSNSCLYVLPEEIIDTEGAAGASAKPEDNHLPVDAILMGTINNCAVQNRPGYVGIEVSKDWDITNSGGNVVEMYAEIDVMTRGDLVGGYYCGDGFNCKTLTFIGENPADQTVSVRPTYKGVKVYFDEDGVDSYIETENDCDGSVTVMPGDDSESCAFVNSVFFEGIPTLSQYGMAIMALLMLGVGFVGFRRFV